MEPGYLNLLRKAAQTPWAILPADFAIIVDVLSRRAAGERLDDSELHARIQAARPAHRQSRVAADPGAVAVLPLHGPIFPRANLMTELSGATSLATFRTWLREALENEQVGSIVLDVHSPGGVIDLVPETAAEIREARATKPIIAVANTQAASAAYWIASQADELVVTPSGDVGSIGVFAAHDDISRALDMRGVTTTLVSAGKYKVEGNPFEPLGDEARAALQETVDEFYDMFVRDVATGRRSTSVAVRDGFGQGRMVTATRAVALGMADRVDTLERTIRDLHTGAGRRSSRARSARVSLDSIRAELAHTTELARRHAPRSHG
jgi:signal peptide peptidase SppA